MSKTHQQIWVELVGKIIVARIYGEPTLDLLRQRHARITQLHTDTGCASLLLDDLDMYAMDYESVTFQQSLNPELNALGIRIAILVPNSQLAYLARLQFGEHAHKVFYNDMEGAILWLSNRSNTGATDANPTVGAN